MLQRLFLATLVTILVARCSSNDPVVVGRLSRIALSPPCSQGRYGVVAEYTDLKVIQGDFNLDIVYVVHGCPELRRQDYGETSGSLTRFRLGDMHVLHLSKKNVYRVGSISDADAKGRIPHPEAFTYFCKSVDLFKPGIDSLTRSSVQ